MKQLLAAFSALLFAAPALAQDEPFSEWLNDFRPRLEAQGASPQTSVRSVAPRKRPSAVNRCSRLPRGEVMAKVSPDQAQDAA